MSCCSRRVDVREVVNAVRYLLRSGCLWRLLPREFPPWPTLYAYFRRWEADGTWERVAGALRRDLRAGLGRRPELSSAVLDSQTAKTTEKAGRGLDGGKRNVARKRHFLVDTEGFLTELMVHPANVSESAGAELVLAKAQAAGRALGKVWVDGGHQQGCVDWARAQLGYEVEVVARSPGARGFRVLPKRWVVERSFAWATSFRRLAKDYERLPGTMAGPHFAAFACPMLDNVALLPTTGP